MSDQPGMVSVGNIHEMDYWCETAKIFKYLDAVSPLSGSKFKCPVCSGSHWGCSTVQVTDQNGVVKSVVAPCDFPIMLPDGKRMQMNGRDFPNFHYALICVTCSNTVFLNAAMVQARMKVTEVLKDGQ